jgi:hypothetical protein
VYLIGRSAARRSGGVRREALPQRSLHRGGQPGKVPLEEVVVVSDLHHLDRPLLPDGAGDHDERQLLAGLFQQRQRGGGIKPLRTLTRQSKIDGTLVLGLLSFLVVFTGWVALALCAVVDFLATRDLQRMGEGTLDPAGCEQARRARKEVELATLLGGFGGLGCGPIAVVLAVQVAQTLTRR